MDNIESILVSYLDTIKSFDLMKFYEYVQIERNNGTYNDSKIEHLYLDIFKQQETIMQVITHTLYDRFYIM